MCGGCWINGESMMDEWWMDGLMDDGWINEG
jgi:hypothetical protein